MVTNKDMGWGIAVAVLLTVISAFVGGMIMAPNGGGVVLFIALFALPMIAGAFAGGFMLAAWAFKRGWLPNRELAVFVAAAMPAVFVAAFLAATTEQDLSIAWLFLPGGFIGALIAFNWRGRGTTSETPS